LNFFVSKIGNAVEVTHELTANTAAFLISSDGVMPFTSSDFDADDEEEDATNKTLPFPPLNPPLEDVKTTSSRQRVFLFLFFHSPILLLLLLLFILLLFFLFFLLFLYDDNDATVVENIIFNIVLLLRKQKKN
jgi:hypothetical protein